VRRLGVPIYLRHTIVEALGEEYVTGAVIQEIDERFQPVGEGKTLDVDIICMAVGLTPTCELLWQAGCKMAFVPELCGYVAQRDRNMRTSHPDIWVAGDAAGIEEASSAMVEGRIAGVNVAKVLGYGSSSDHEKRLSGYRRRLDALRGGEVGEKIRHGLARCTIDNWEV
jgi:sarcosine oxidase subunit alpha